MRRLGSWFLIVGLVLLAACSRQPTSNCEPAGRYTTASSAPPVQIPDDLSPPNETDAIRLPPQIGVPGTLERCLESPPSFSGTARRDGASASDVPAEAPATESPPLDGDRVIEN